MLRVITALRRKTDHRRWEDPRSLDAAWEPRSRQVAAMVPKNSRVIEFGAGNRVLERYLDPSCSYVPSDLVDRGPGTIVCNLNERPLPDLAAHNFDVAVFIGVLEYVQDVPSVLDWMAKYVSSFVLACAPAKANGYSLRATIETFGRLKAGWINNYREDDLRALFHERGYELVQDDSWLDQRLYVFSQRPTVT
jgi:hypothetical protein